MTENLCVILADQLSKDISSLKNFRKDKDKILMMEVANEARRATPPAMLNEYIDWMEPYLSDIWMIMIRFGKWAEILERPFLDNKESFPVWSEDGEVNIGSRVRSDNLGDSRNLISSRFDVFSRIGSPLRLVIDEELTKLR